MPHTLDDARPDGLPSVGDSGETGETPTRAPRWGRRIVAVLLALVLLAVALVGGFALFLNQKVDNVRREALLPDQVQDQGNGAQPSASAAPDASPAVDGDGTPPTLTMPDVAHLIGQSKGTNVLIIGTDTRPGDVGRSDVMVLAHVDEAHSQVHLVHFPRDLWVSIPGRGKAKLNAAYAYGGAPLLVQSIQNLIGVRIDHVAKTDFGGFQRMVDALGGVRVYAEESGGGISQGWNDLDGARALGFVRERKSLSQGDISRGKRQMALIKAILTKAISPDVITNPVKIAQFTDAATDNLVVDQSMTTGWMREQAFALRGVRSGDIVFVTAPYTGFGWSADGQSIDIVDQPGMQALGDALRHDRMGDYRRTTVIP